MTSVAAVLSTAPFVAIAGLQAALALAAPLGGQVLSGRYGTTLPDRLRAFSGVAALLLLGVAVVVLARAGVVAWTSGRSALLALATWAIAACLTLNTLGSLASKGGRERTIMAAGTAILALLWAHVAYSGPSTAL